MKIKHNKVKNTGLIYELLVRQLASDILSNKDSKSFEIINKYYKNTEISKEYKLYNTLIHAGQLTESKADVFISTILEVSKRINKTKLKKEKYNLIKEVKETYDIENFFKAKVNDYKVYASMYNLIEATNSNEFIAPAEVIDNKVTLLEFLTKKDIDKEGVQNQVLEEYAESDKATKIIAYKILVEKFNKKYSSLTPDQKNVLKEYINNISSTQNLKEFLNQEILKAVKILSELKKTVKDEVVKIKLTEVIKTVEPIDKKDSVKDHHVLAVLQYYELIKEIKSIK